MILTAHQPTYLPWLGLFDKIGSADTYVSFNQAQYEPRGFQNRNLIKTTSGELWLTVPVLKSGHRKVPMSDIKINNQLPWQRKHWRSITHHYSKAPYFEEISLVLQPFYNREWETLVELNEAMLVTFLGLLRIEVEFLYASDYKFKGRNSALVADMCRQLKADSYVFGGEGKDYANPEDFKGITLLFQEYNHPTYPQLQGGFVSHLSIIDLLMNCGPGSLEILETT